MSTNKRRWKIVIIHVWHVDYDGTKSGLTT